MLIASASCRVTVVGYYPAGSVKHHVGVSWSPPPIFVLSGRRVGVVMGWVVGSVTLKELGFAQQVK